MLTWGERTAAAPEVAATGREMLYQFGVGLGLLATVRADLKVEREMAEEPPGFDDEQLLELRVDTCLTTWTTGHGDGNPQHSVWRA